MPHTKRSENKRSGGQDSNARSRPSGMKINDYEPISMKALTIQDNSRDFYSEDDDDQIDSS